MIVGSLLLILVAVGLLVAGVLGGSNALIICCIIVVILAAVVLVLGVKQSAAAGLVYGTDIDGEIEGDVLTTEYPAVGARGFRVRQSDRRINEDTAPVAAITTRREARVAAAATADLAQIVVEEQVARGIPAQGTEAYRDTPSRKSHALPDGEPYDPPVQSFDAPSFDAPSNPQSSAEPAPYEQPPAYDDPQAYDAFGDATSEALPLAGVVEAEQAFEGDFDEDPPDEPSAQMVSPSNAARVAMLSTDVLVVDGRPRYHVAGCVHLHGRETEPLPVGEAVELGFTPCALCEPDSALLADARRV